MQRMPYNLVEECSGEAEASIHLNQNLFRKDSVIEGIVTLLRDGGILEDDHIKGGPEEGFKQGWVDYIEEQKGGDWIEEWLEDNQE